MDTDIDCSIQIIKIIVWKYIHIYNVTVYYINTTLAKQVKKSMQISANWFINSVQSRMPYKT